VSEPGRKTCGAFVAEAKRGQHSSPWQ
jgi:hypothetical protein